MDERTRLIALGAVALLALVVIFGVVVFVSRISSNRAGTRGPINDLVSRLPAPSPTPTPVSTTPSVSPESKTYTGPGFTLSYPRSWGILTCNNSSNFELDPTAGQDVLRVVCDEAIKPVTVLVVTRASCLGEFKTIGSHQVVFSKVTEGDGDINYRWCLAVGEIGLDITHRVSPSGSPATSKTDFSSQVEGIITTVKSS